MQLRNTARLGALRWSLLASMGIVPLACGGNTDQRSNASTGGTAVTAGSGGSDGIAGASVTPGGRAPAGQPPACTSPTLDARTHLISCSEGYLHRPEATRCEPVMDPSSAGGAGAGAASDPALGGAADQLPLATGSESCAGEAGPDDAACAGFEHGFCRTVVPSANCLRGCCFSGCVTDDDCASGSVCVCGSTRSPTGGECVRGQCATDDDCAGGFRCASYDDVCGNALPQFACQNPADECSSSKDCNDHPCAVGAVTPDVRQCFTGTCGRPFLIEAEARVAPVIEGSEWLLDGPAQPRLDHLTLDERRALAAHWQQMGQLEHASIAAFARFSLQLLSLGAPPELVESCTRALADETAHTKLCFRIASAYAGCAVGPGRLDIDGSLGVTSLADVAELVMIEGCFGETAAALDAFDAANTATDPVIARAYSTIAADEQRHAELAFCFLRWALERGGAPVAARIAAVAAAPPSSHQAARAVTLPCLNALLASHRAERGEQPTLIPTG